MSLFDKFKQAAAPAVVVLSLATAFAPVEAEAQQYRRHHQHRGGGGIGPGGAAALGALGIIGGAIIADQFRRGGGGGVPFGGGVPYGGGGGYGGYGYDRSAPTYDRSTPTPDHSTPYGYRGQQQGPLCTDGYNTFRVGPGQRCPTDADSRGYGRGGPRWYRRRIYKNPAHSAGFFIFRYIFKKPFSAAMFCRARGKGDS